MRGAVLYKLGLDYVKDRVMRRSYGVPTSVIFRDGYHPVSRRWVDAAGDTRCQGVMRWFASKVPSLLVFTNSRVKSLRMEV
jgi:hypothetical protein